MRIVTTLVLPVKDLTHGECSFSDEWRILIDIGIIRYYERPWDEDEEEEDFEDGDLFTLAPKEETVILGTVLLHEMIHQYCFENGIDEGNHNDTWQQIARQHGLISIYKDGKKESETVTEPVEQLLSKYRFRGTQFVRSRFTGAVLPNTAFRLFIRKDGTEALIHARTGEQHILQAGESFTLPNGMTVINNIANPELMPWRK